MATPEDHGHAYHAKDAIGDAATSGFKTGIIGAMFSGIQATLTKQNIGAFGAVTKYGGTMAMFAATGATYSFVREVSSNLREEDDWKNSMLGGLFAGGLVGIYRRSIPGMIGIGVMTGVAASVLTYTGGELRARPDPRRDIYAEREHLRKNYRSPVEETIAQLGEGRGIRGPGYEERRKQRIKENYGIDVPP